VKVTVDLAIPAATVTDHEDSDSDAARPHGQAAGSHCHGHHARAGPGGPSLQAGPGAGASDTGRTDRELQLEFHNGSETLVPASAAVMIMTLMPGVGLPSMVRAGPCRPARGLGA
jgi:hypothetical protein